MAKDIFMAPQDWYALYHMLAERGLLDKKTPFEEVIKVYQRSGQQTVLENMLNVLMKKRADAYQKAIEPSPLTPPLIANPEQKRYPDETDRKELAVVLFKNYADALEKLALRGEARHAATYATYKGDPGFTFEDAAFVEESDVLHTAIIPYRENVNALVSKGVSPYPAPLPSEPNRRSLVPLYNALQEEEESAEGWFNAQKKYARVRIREVMPDQLEAGPSSYNTESGSGGIPKNILVTPSVRKWSWNDIYNQWAVRPYVRAINLRIPHVDSGMLFWVWLLLWFVISVVSTTGAGQQTRLSLLLGVLTSTYWIPPPDLQAVQQQEASGLAGIGTFGEGVAAGLANATHIEIGVLSGLIRWPAIVLQTLWGNL